MTLSDAQVNNFYTLVSVCGEESARRRLLDMGFTPGCKIYVAAIAPMKGTVLVSLRNFTVALREDAASMVEVEAA